MTDLVIGNAGFALPIGAVTETFAIIARRGRGKTYAASVIAEEMLEQQQRLVIIDPTGAWWGLRSTAAGDADGYQVIIFGGDHADLPLDEHAGSAIADLVVDNDLAVICDLSLLRKGAQRRFMRDFAETLYHRNRRALHLFIDEADQYAPQRVDADSARLLGALEDIVRLGRRRGLGTTLITQRPAVLNKNVLTQTEVLIALQITGPQDRKALDDWIRQNAEGDQRDQFLDSLASLPVGRAWVWSPAWLDVFEQVQIRKRRTFDSGATPKPGAAEERPTSYATIDLDAVREQMAEVVDRAADSDPRVLRGEVERLRRELAAAQAEPSPVERVVETVTVEVPVPVVDDRLAGRLDAWVAAVDRAEGVLGPLGAETAKLAAELADVVDRDRRELSDVPQPAPVDFPRWGRDVGYFTDDTPVAAPGDGDGDISLRAGGRRMLAALATPPGVRRSKSQIAFMAAVKQSGGTFGTYWRELVRGGFIVEDGDGAVITDAGVDQLDPDDVVSAPQTTADVLALWEPKLRKGVRAMLHAVLDAHPRPVGKQALADATGYEITGGTFGTYLAELRRMDLVVVNDGIVHAGATMFPGGS